MNKARIDREARAAADRLGLTGAFREAFITVVTDEAEEFLRYGTQNAASVMMGQGVPPVQMTAVFADVVSTFIDNVMRREEGVSEEEAVGRAYFHLAFFMFRVGVAYERLRWDTRD